MNKVILMGRLVADPEQRRTQLGKAATNIRLAVNRRFAKPEDEKKADFIECVIWGSTAEFVCKYFRKGRMVCVVGALHDRKWQDREGNTRYTVEVAVDEVYFTGDRGEKQQPGTGDYEPVGDEEELPF